MTGYNIDGLISFQREFLATESQDFRWIIPPVPGEKATETVEARER
jgi:hypothetical protein